MDDLTDERTKRYIHHCNFPPYSVGEICLTRPQPRPPRNQPRRALAERALVPVLPSLEEFPTIRCACQGPGSTAPPLRLPSAAPRCSLMDAGVPIKAPVPMSPAA